MSGEKNLEEAIRWLTTAEDDLNSAVILHEHGQFAHACFHSQQSAEKASKAVWYFADEDPWGHSIYKLIADLEDVNLRLYQELKPLHREAQVLDRFYIPTRYPNGLPDITPNQAFNEEDAKLCIEYAGKILETVRGILKR